MKVAIYARESSADTSKAPDIAGQLSAYQSWCKEREYISVTEYRDNGYSGGDWNRPGWLQAVKDAKRHLWQVLWVWHQDRIARDTEQFLWFYRNLNTAKVKIYEHVTGQYIDLSTLGDRVKHQSLAQADEIFRLVTSEKVKKAYQRNKEKGKPWGRKKKELDIEAIRMLRSQGLGYRKIAAEIGENYQTVRRALRRDE